MAGAKPNFPKPKPTAHPVDVGLLTEGAILSHLIRCGYSVLLPFGVNQRYDLVLDMEGRFVRAQSKTGRLRQGAICFNTQSIVTTKTRNVPRGYTGQADVFLVFCPEFDQIYLVPVEEAPRTLMRLRVDPCRNGQCQGVNWAADYLLPA